MADRNLDEYKHVKFYADNTKTKQAGFSKFNIEKDFYFCRYIDGNVAMISQAYTSEAGRDNGIESVKKNEKLAKRYVFEARGAKEHGFGLKAGNGQEIAISPSYTSLAKAEQVSGRLTGKTKAKTAASKKTAPKKAAAKAKPKKAAASKPVVAAAVLSGATTKPNPGNVEQNYMPLAFYKKATKGKKTGFESFKGDDGEHYFTYFENEKIALISEGYPTAAIRDKGLASVEKNIKTESRYVYGKGVDGKEGFALRAGNNKEIARSVGYGSAAAAAAGAAYLLGTRRRAARKKTKSVAVPRAAGIAAAAVGASAAEPKAVKKLAAKPKAVKKPKSIKKKAKPAVVPLAAGSVAVAALGASAAAAKIGAVKKAALPVKAAAIKPVTFAAPAAAPIAAAALGTAAVAGAASIAAAPKAKPVAVAPVAAAIPAATAPAAGGGGIWGWLKWLLIGLIMLLAAMFLFKACAGGDKDVKAASPVTTTQTVAPAAMVTCWNGSKAKNDQACPTKITCWDNSFATQQSSCPVKPAAIVTETPAVAVNAAKTTAGSTIKSASPEVSVANATTRLTTAKMTAPSVAGRICGPSPNVLFDVSGVSPISITRLGTNPQFGNSMTYTPNEFFRRLQVKYTTSPRDKSFLDLTARSLGYGAFSDMDASMFTNDTLPNGSSGLLGFGTHHALQFSTLNVTDASHLEAFKVRSANGTDVHFMKRCGNFMYVCQP